jgi:hypothetical protein
MKFRVCFICLLLVMQAATPRAQAWAIHRQRGWSVPGPGGRYGVVHRTVQEVGEPTAFESTDILLGPVQIPLDSRARRAMSALVLVALLGAIGYGWFRLQTWRIRRNEMA